MGAGGGPKPAGMVGEGPDRHRAGGRAARPRSTGRGWRHRSDRPIGAGDRRPCRTANTGSSCRWSVDRRRGQRHRAERRSAEQTGPGSRRRRQRRATSPAEPVAGRTRGAALGAGHVHVPNDPTSAARTLSGKVCARSSGPRSGRGRRATIDCGGAARRRSSKRLRNTATGAAWAPRSSASIDRRTSLMVPSPASATSTTRSGWSCLDERDGVAVPGQRRTHTARALDEPDLRRRESPGDLDREVGDRRTAGAPATRRPSGGAIGTSYHRWCGHTSAAVSPVASASWCGVGARDRRHRRTGPASGPRRVTPWVRRSSASRAVSQVLPISVPVPAITTTYGVGRGRS